MTAPPPTARRPQLRALTGLRFPAALLVVALHARELLPPLPRPLTEVVGAGQLAVSLFFVLSGFILVYSAATAGPQGGLRLTTSPADFWWARFSRVYPVYALGLLLDAPTFVPWMLGGELSRSGPAALLLSPALLQAWLPQTACLWNCPGWSISAEALFYLLFPLLLAPVAALAARPWWGALGLWGLRLLPVGVLVAALPWPLPDPSVAVDATYYTPLLRLPEFAMGMLLGVLFLRRGPFLRGGRLWRWGGLLVAVALSQAEPLLGNTVRNVLAVPALAAVVWGLATGEATREGRGGRAGVLSSGSAVYLGQISYAVYILHAPLLNALRAARRAGLVPTGGVLPLLLYLIALLLGSALAYHVLERPAQAALRRWGPPRWLQRLGGAKTPT